MTETEYAESYDQALKGAERLKVVTGDEREELLLQLSENALILRQTAIRDHLDGCSIHTDCGWGDVPEPNNPLNDFTWESGLRQGLLAEAAEGIRTGAIVPWAPQPKPDFSNLPFYRAR